MRRNGAKGKKVLGKLKDVPSYNAAKLSFKYAAAHMGFFLHHYLHGSALYLNIEAFSC